MMELASFIKNSLLDIINAVKDAQAEAGGGVVAPGIKTSTATVEHGTSNLQVVDFEVAVGFDESKGSEGKLGVVSSLVGVGIAGKSAAEKRHANVLKFRIPIRLPTSRKIK